MRALNRLQSYMRKLNHSLHEHIDVMYTKMWTFHVRFIEHYELAVEQQMSIVLESLPDSWDLERKALEKQLNDLNWNNLQSELNGELECRIQNGIR